MPLRYAGRGVEAAEEGGHRYAESASGPEALPKHPSVSEGLPSGTPRTPAVAAPPPRALLSHGGEDAGLVLVGVTKGQHGRGRGDDRPEQQEHAGQEGGPVVSVQRGGMKTAASVVPLDSVGSALVSCGPGATGVADLAQVEGAIAAPLGGGGVIPRDGERARRAIPPGGEDATQAGAKSETDRY